MTALISPLLSVMLREILLLELKIVPLEKFPARIVGAPRSTRSLVENPLLELENVPLKAFAETGKSGEVVVPPTCALDSLSKKVGFTSYNPFFTSFKEVSGVSPLEYYKMTKVEVEE